MLVSLQSMAPLCAAAAVTEITATMLSLQLLFLTLRPPISPAIFSGLKQHGEGFGVPAPKV
jgi:hypothetical protein